ncbi:MAG: tRNA (guanosine(37)-N1)-methyltransferase TrmD [Candidatus Moranbacteria bacterium CG23_combo_of_CG06-09_8_20_14_all_35_22]|nr:MAG: tRNA (guanosine(37)-N1)-methyltransferase TrmD [Candidatus Moranbacteria bacterium CG23_combo_of_CG06-09_8_20_14_all_35_22]
MKFDIITIFPEIFGSYFNESILKRAQKNNLIEIKIHNLRDFTLDKHKTTDDTPYGGGAGMVMKIEPIYESIKFIKLKVKNKKTRTILFSAKGKKYTQSDAKRLSKYDNLIFICGRYEGVDERVAKYLADEEISVGDFVLTGGEIPAMILVDSISRLLPRVLGNSESTKNESHNSKNYLEHSQYTKPEKFLNWKVPEILLSGNHKKIEEWRKKNSKFKASNPK